MVGTVLGHTCSGVERYKDAAIAILKRDIYSLSLQLCQTRSYVAIVRGAF